LVKLGALVALLARPETPHPVAIVYSLAGEASLEAPGLPSRPVRLFDRLATGTAVEVGPGSRLALAFVNGLRYELGEQSRVTVGTKDLGSRSGPVRPLRRVPRLPGLAPIAAEDHPGPRAGAVRVRGERVRGLYPSRGAATLAGATSLRFAPVEGGRRYRIEVQDRQGTLIFAAETQSSTVTIPAGSLRPGARYDWLVRTLEREGPTVQAKADFTTLTAEAAEERETLRRALTIEGDGASLALLAEVDWSLGLFAEAHEELRAAALGSPGDTLLAANLAERERLLAYLQSP
jgi:hypothetical protein